MELELELKAARFELAARGPVTKTVQHDQNCACPFCEMKRELAAVTAAHQATLDDLMRAYGKPCLPMQAVRFVCDELAAVTKERDSAIEDSELRLRLAQENARLRNQALAQNAQMRTALDTATTAIQEWCDAVDADASWEGWDSCFKDCKWELLPKLREALSTPAH